MMSLPNVLSVHPSNTRGMSMCLSLITWAQYASRFNAFRINMRYQAGQSPCIRQTRSMLGRRHYCWRKHNDAAEAFSREI